MVGWVYMSAYQKYTELDVWKHYSRALASHVYELTATFPKSEQFGIVSQIRRYVVSVPSNIAEGCGRQYKKRLYNFCQSLEVHYMNWKHNFTFQMTYYTSQKINYLPASQKLRY
jgi:hypothetical protein